MFSPKAIPARDKTPFLVRSSDRVEGLEPRMFLDEPSDEPEAKKIPDTVQASTDLLIKGLMDRLPEPNSEWSLDDRTRWLQTAASVFGLIYETADGEQRDITIALDGPRDR